MVEGNIDLAKQLCDIEVRSTVYEIRRGTIYLAGQS